MNELIFDRTQADVNYAINHPSSATFLKGAYNYTDLNRIETWCEYLAEILTSYNYFVKINAKTDWTMSDFPTSQELERIRKNVNDLKQAYFSFTQIPANLEYLTWQKANDIEKILFEIDKIIGYMESEFIYCGVAACGQSRIWQKRFRHRKYERYSLKNIIPDSSFENDGWGGANYSSAEKLVGDRSLYFPIGTTIIANIEVERPIIGHKYYGRRYIKTAGENQPADCRFEVFGGDGANMNWIYAWNNGNHPTWDFGSAIHEIAGVAYAETNQTIIRCFNVNTTADTWVDGLMLIDLTECFGAGNEPALEWCDNNIPYFSGKTIIRKIKEE